MNLLDLLKGAAQGLVHLHMRHIVHGDLNVSLNDCHIMLFECLDCDCHPGLTFRLP
jgi:hypothetical protein